MTKRKEGGQPGNRNAYKHGFYAKNFSTDEMKLLKKYPGLDNEIESARIIARRIFNRVTENGLSLEESGKVDAQTNNTVNTYANLMAAISNLARSYQLLVGKYQPVETEILAALRELNAEQGYDDV